MKKISYLILASLLVLSLGQLSCSAVHDDHEHGGKEHAGQEHGGKEHAGEEHGDKEHAGQEHGGEEHGGEQITKEPSANEIRQAMKEYVLRVSAERGSFNIYDKETRKNRRLALIRVHERVGKTGNYYYSCADFNDLDSGELLDLDLDVDTEGGNLSVVDVRIHKVKGRERYTYDKNDNRIPIS